MGGRVTEMVEGKGAKKTEQQRGTTGETRTGSLVWWGWGWGIGRVSPVTKGIDDRYYILS